MPSVEEAVRLLTSQPHALRYTFDSQDELRAFVNDVRQALEYDSARLRWRMDGYLRRDGKLALVFWMDTGQGYEVPDYFA